MSKVQEEGHYTTKCLAKTTVAEMTMQMDTLTTGESDHPDDTFDTYTVFLNTVDGDSKDSGTSWYVTITVANTQISFKVDTGMRTQQCQSQHGRNSKTQSSWARLNSSFMAQTIYL